MRTFARYTMTLASLALTVASSRAAHADSASPSPPADAPTDTTQDVGPARSPGTAPEDHAQSSAPPLQSAEPETTTPSPASVADSQWYGWETLLADGAAFGTTMLGASTSSGPVAAVGFGLYALAPPMVHAAHGRPKAALVDLGIRLATPMAFGTIGYMIDYAANPCPARQDGWGFCFRGFAGAGVGLLVGYATAVLFDATWLAREPVVKKSDGSAAIRWAPTVAVTPTGGSGGVSGVF